MKKKIAIALLISIPMVACNSIKAPSFARYSNEVSYEDFVKGFSESSFEKFFDFTQSMTGKAYLGAKTNTLAKAGDFTLDESESISQLNYSFKIDSVNNRSIATLKGEGKGEGKGAEGKGQEVSKISTTRQYQYEEVDGKTQLVTIDKAQQVYYLSDYTDIGTASTSSCLSYTVYPLSYITLYSTLDEETQKAFSFYIDGNIFTFKVDLSTTGKSFQDEKQITETTIDTDILYQVELSDNKMQCRYSNMNKTTYHYLDFYGSHEKGEIDSYTDTLYYNSEVKLENVSISKIDVSNYAFRSQDLDKPEGQ